MACEWYNLIYLCILSSCLRQLLKKDSPMYTGNDTLDTVCIGAWHEANMSWRQLSGYWLAERNLLRSTLPRSSRLWWNPALYVIIWSRSVWWCWWGWEGTKEFFLQLVLLFHQCRSANCFIRPCLDSDECGHTHPQRSFVDWVFKNLNPKNNGQLWRMKFGLLCWKLWENRNRRIFQDHSPNADSIALNVNVLLEHNIKARQVAEFFD